MADAQWQYKSLLLDVSGWISPKIHPEQLDAEINALGAQGWELVSAFDVNKGHGSSSGIVALFKRPKR